MSILSSLFRKKKPNLTPDTSFANQQDLFHTGQLRDLTKRRLGGQDLGFGEDFLSKSSSAPIASREARFNEQEMPFLNSQLSSRGLSRSAGPNLATDVLGRASQNKERDINNIVSELFMMNEAQKKADFGQALQQANTMQGQEQQMLSEKASASERLANATAAQQNKFQDQDRAQAGGMLQAAGLAASGPLGMGLDSILNGLGVGKMFNNNSLISGTAKSYNAASPKTMTIDDLKGNDIQSLLRLLEQL